MATHATPVSKQTLYLTIFIAFIAGFLAGVVFTIYRTGDSATGIPATMPHQHNLGQQEAQAILNLEAEVTTNPNNFEAWTRLGHLYFDTDQPQKAITAYHKALELHDGDADLYTDLGVMYRRVGDSEKALEQFEKAIGVDDRHLQSRFNKGIVLHFDLGRTDEAIASWQSVLAIDSDYRMANNRLLREFLETVTSEANH